MSSHYGAALGCSGNERAAWQVSGHMYFNLLHNPSSRPASQCGMLFCCSLCPDHSWAPIEIEYGTTGYVSIIAGYLLFGDWTEISMPSKCMYILRSLSLLSLQLRQISGFSKAKKLHPGCYKVWWVPYGRPGRSCPQVKASSHLRSRVRPKAELWSPGGMHRATHLSERAREKEDLQ